LPEQTSRRWDQALRHVLRSRQPASFMYELQTSLGDRFVQVRLAPRFGHDTRLLGVLVVARDLTDLIQRQRAREHLYDTMSVRLDELQALVTRALGGAGREERQRQLARLASELQPREVTMLRMVALGRDNREIGQALHLSPGTVKNYIVRLVDKLGVCNRAEAAARAAELGYLEDDPN
jgi:DNA-binding NarL/FixJ family response regulator